MGDILLIALRACDTQIRFLHEVDLKGFYGSFVVIQEERKISDAERL